MKEKEYEKKKMEIVEGKGGWKVEKGNGGARGSRMKKNRKEKN